MNIDINILPKEMRAKPLVDARTVLLAVLVVALAYGIYFFYQAKSDAQDENAAIASTTAELEQQALALSTDPEAIQLTNSISQLRAAQQDYSTFMASLVGWGDALDRAYKLVPKGVTIASITQSGNGLVVKGSSTTIPAWSGVNAFALALDGDAGFELQSIPTFTAGGFTLAITVAPGGGR